MSEKNIPKRLSLSGMPLVAASDDGSRILFRFATHIGKQFDFECDPSAVPEMVARLTAAHEESASKKDPSPDRPRNCLAIDKYEIGVGRQGQAVILTLYPTPNSGIDFAFPADFAERMSTDLAKHASLVVRRKDPKSLS